MSSMTASIRSVPTPARKPPVGWRPVATLVLVTSFAILAATVAATRSGAAQDETHANASLEERDDSGITGTVSLEADGNNSTVVRVRANAALGEHPTHIHSGTCDDLDPNPKYPLNNVELRTRELAGTSETVIAVPVSDFLENEHLVLIHESTVELGNYLACGNIVAGQARETGAGGARAGNPLAQTGSGGTAAPGRSQAARVATLGGMAVVLGAGGALALRLRQRRGGYAQRRGAGHAPG